MTVLLRLTPVDALIAQQASVLKREVLNVKHVVLEHLVLVVNHVVLVTIVMAATLLRSLAEIAQRVTSTTTRVKVHVCHAVPVNSMMLSVLFNVKIVLPIHTTVTKKGNQVASIAQSVGSRWLAV